MEWQRIYRLIYLVWDGYFKIHVLSTFLYFLSLYRENLIECLVSLTLIVILALSLVQIAKTGRVIPLIVLGCPTPEFSIHRCQLKTANFDLCSALMAIEQWGFFSVPHLLWHQVFFYNGHLRGPVTLTPIAERMAVELSLPVLMN